MPVELIASKAGILIALFIIITRSCAPLRAADLDWIVGPGYSSGGYILGKTMKNQPRTLKKNEKQTGKHEKP